MQRLSVIVPLMGDLQRFEDTLVSVLENQPERSEVIVVLNAPYDDPYDLRSEVKFVETAAGADLVQCFACGLGASEAPVVHVLASGFEATPGWADAALARFDSANVAAVAPLVVDRLQPTRILSGGLRYSGGTIRRLACNLDAASGERDASKGLCGPELSAAFYRRSALESVALARYRGSILAVSTGLALGLRKAGFVTVQEPGCQATATADLFTSGGAWREGLAAEWLFRRWKSMPGWNRSWAAHAATVAMECVQLPLRPSMAARLAGRLCARLGFGAPATVPIHTPATASQRGTVIRPAHFSAAESRPALHTRVAG